MVLSLVKGQKINLTKNQPEINLIHIGLDWRAPRHFDIDVSAFLLGKDEKIVREEDFVFYGQPVSSNGSVSLEESISTIEKQHFTINLENVSEEVQKIAFTLTIYESDINGYTFEAVSGIQLRIVRSNPQQEMATFPITYSFTKESAIVLGTLYRYSGEWKFHAVGSGFYGGLADLCAEYGVDVDPPMDEAQKQVSTNQTQTDPNQRFQTVQERAGALSGEVIPNPPTTEHVQLKRSSVVQFNDSRIETLAHQSTELIHLFADQQEEAAPTPSNTTATTLSTNFLLSNTEEVDQDAFFQSLSETERNFLLLIDNGQVSVDSAKAYLKKHGQMLALFVNSINEKANEHLDDILLQIENEAITVYEEFKPLVEKSKERIRNEH